MIDLGAHVGKFHELADGSQVVLDSRMVDGREIVQGVRLVKNGVTLFNSQVDRNRRIRIFPLTREWAIEPRPPGSGEILKVGG